MRLLKALFLFTAILASNNIIAQCAFFAVVNNHGNSSYGIKNDGSLWVWGWNNYGQLGDGSTMDRINPVQVGTAKNWKFVAAGERFAFAINEDGKLFGWGWNAYGQLGDGTYNNSLSPIQIGTANNWVSVSAGNAHVLAKTKDGMIWSWGNNSYGALGDGTLIGKNVPTQIGTDTNWLSIVAGNYHSLALNNEGKIYAWGLGAEGQLGIGSNIDKKEPTLIQNSTYWIEIKAGMNHSLARNFEGKLFAWGSNSKGQLGDNTNANKNIPIQIGTETNWKYLSAGYNFSMARTIDGKIYTWGDNTYGQLGDGTITQRNIPTRIGANYFWDEISAGGSHAIARTTNGTLFSFGSNDKGQLGDGTYVLKLLPISITSGPKLVINTQPVAQNLCNSSNVNYYVSATGSGYITYQWKRNGTPVGVNSYQLSLYNLAEKDTGYYKVYISNSCSNVVSDSVRLIFGKPTSIVSNPTASLNCNGSSTSMSVTANGAGNLSYQWSKNGYNIGTNSKTLNINNISNNDAGFYKVLVTGACGTALSDSTKLSVQPNILITNKLIPQTVNEGNYVSFLIQATEFGVTNNYQWKKNGINLTNSANVSGVNNNKLTIPKADMESQGLYTVDVSNNCNTLKSNEVALVVNKKVGSPPIVSSIESIETMANIHIAPNPSVEYILVNGFFLNNSDVNIEIINLEGKLLYTKKINQFSNQGAANNENINFSERINLDNFISGSYIAKIANNGNTTSKQFIISK